MNIPKHTFILWVAMQNKLPVCSTIAGISGGAVECQLCQGEEETLEHLLSKCSIAREVCTRVKEWLGLKHETRWADWLHNLQKVKTKPYWNR